MFLEKKGSQISAANLCFGRSDTWSGQCGHQPLWSSFLRKTRASVKVGNADERLSNSKEPNAEATFFWSVFYCCHFVNAIPPLLLLRDGRYCEIVHETLGRTMRGHSPVLFELTQEHSFFQKNIFPMLEATKRNLYLPWMEGHEQSIHSPIQLCVDCSSNIWVDITVFSLSSYIHLGDNQPTFTGLGSLLSCWFESVHRSKQQVPEPEAGREAGEVQQGEDKKVLATNCQVSSRNSVDLHLSARCVTV